MAMSREMEGYFCDELAKLMDCNCRIDLRESVTNDDLPGVIAKFEEALSARFECEFGVDGK